MAMTRTTADCTPTVVVLRALKVGDLLAAVPALRAIRRAFPGHRRLLLAPAPLTWLTCALDVGHTVLDTAEYGPIGGSVARPEVAIDLHGCGPQSTDRLRALSPRRLIGFGVTSTWRAGENERARWCRLLTEGGIPADPVDLHVWTSDHGPAERHRGCTIVHVGASAPARRWPVDRWVAVIAEEVQARRHVVLTGDRSEVDLVREVGVRANLSERDVLAGRTSLLELLDLVGTAGMVVSGDTGIAHMAYATGTPSVTLFGPVPPSEWGPPPTGPHQALWAGRTGDPHAAAPDAGLLDIDVETVLAAMRRLRTTHGTDVAIAGAAERTP